MIHTTEYGDITLDYEIHQTEDGAKAIIINVNNEDGTVKNIYYIHSATIEDMQFVCESDYFNIQVNHYKRTGDTLYE